MKRIQQVLDKIQLLEESYEINILSDEHAKKETLKFLSKIIKEILNSKKLFNEEDFKIIKNIDFSKYNLLSIFNQECLTLDQIRQMADSLGAIIIPIEFSACEPKNKQNQETAKLLNMYTYIITDLKNYDVWKEVTFESENEVGGKYFPDAYFSVYLSIELLLGTQKNLYCMIKKDRRMLNTLIYNFNKNMKNVSEIFEQISENQRRLKRQSDYLLTAHFAIESNNLYMDMEHMKKNYEKCQAMRRLPTSPMKGEGIQSIAAVLSYMRAMDEYKDKLKKTLDQFEKNDTEFQEDYHRMYNARAASLQKNKEEFDQKLVELKKFEYDPIAKITQEFSEWEQKLTAGEVIIFHTISSDPARDNEMVFLNTP